MRNILLLFIISTFTVFNSTAQSKDKELLNTAENIINSKAAVTSFSDTDYIATKITTIKDRYNNSVYSIVDFKPSGFVILSRNKNTYPLIAYSFENNYPENPENLKNHFAWMQDIKYKITKVYENNIKAGSRINSAWDKIENGNFSLQRGQIVVEPLINTKWDQGKYYNSSCPADPAGPDGHVVAGCVATALGQLMNYFRYPASGTGSYSYTHPNYGYLQVDFSQQTYNWDAMPLSLNFYNKDVADLLYHIGVSVDMDYGPNGSGMHNHKGAYILREYFGYTDSTKYLFRDSLSSSFDWTGMLTGNLDQNIPMYYAGWGDTVFQSGHAFIVDGYDVDTFFHINWGWGGSADGFYNIDQLTPAGSDFTLLHEAITNATPDINTAYNCQSFDSLTNMEGCIGDGSGPLFDYDNNQNCKWLIMPDDSISAINLEVVSFETSPGDSLIIYDGPTSNSPVINSLSGQINNLSLSSTNDKVLIEFISDSVNRNEGWLLKYSSDLPEYCSLITTISDSSGIISDGSNSYLYHNNTMCNWKIQPDSISNISVEFTEFDVEANDYVRLIDDQSGNLVADLSGSQNPGVFDIETDKLTIIFDTDNSGRAQGWKLNYNIGPVSNKTHSVNQNFRVFPNPAKNSLNILSTTKSSSFEVKLYSASGKLLVNKLFNKTEAGEKNKIDLSPLSEGLYFIVINSDRGYSKKKIIKH